MNKLSTIIVLSLLAASVASGVDYQTKIQPIFTSNCSVQGCHSGSSPEAGMNLSSGFSYANLVNVTSSLDAPLKRVQPGDTNKSVLWGRISGTRYGDRMPQFSPPLSQTNINLIRDWILQGAPTPVAAHESTLPPEFTLLQNYPNPFNPSTTIEFSLPHSSEVQFTVINLLGEVIDHRELGRLSAGIHQLDWSGPESLGGKLPSGVYFYQIRAGDFSASKKMIWLK